MDIEQDTCIFNVDCDGDCLGCGYYWSEQYEEQQALAAYEEDLAMRAEEYQKVIDQFDDWED